MNSGSKTLSAGLVSLLAVSLLVTFGCSITPNPWKDDLIEQSKVTTASAKGVCVSEGEPALLTRNYEEKLALVPSGEVAHLPLYYRDSCLDRRPYDEFAWAYSDYRGMFSGPIRLHLDVVFSPIHGVVTPIWTVMESDGERSPSWLRHSVDPVVR